MKSQNCIRSAVILLLTAFAAPATAGDLNPPGGPVLPTMKTLQEVEPRVPIGPLTTPGDATATFVITQPGSYYLTGNLTGENLKTGIRIDAANVSLDLRGFSVIGVLGSQTGIHAIGGIGELSISNGTVRGWIGGISVFSEGVRLSDVFVVNNSIGGISLDNFAIVSRCRSFNNGSTGIRVGIGSVITDTIARNNFLSGFVMEEGTTASNCTASSNGANGFFPGVNCTFNNCTAFGNQEAGFLLADGNTAAGCAARNNGGGFVSSFPSNGGLIQQCSAFENSGSGINVDENWAIRSCVALKNTGGGISAGQHSLVHSSLASQNGTLPTLAHGIEVGNYSRVIDCEANANSGNGIVLLSASALGCTASFNGSSGIHLSGFVCDVRQNTCYSNGKNSAAPDRDGIRVAANDCHIDSNKCSLNSGLGITITGLFNLVTRNNLSGDGLVDIGASNRVGTSVATPVGAGAWDNFNF